MSSYYDSLPPPAVGRYWLIAALLLVLLPHLWRLPLWLGVACLALFIWRLFYELKGWPLPGRLLRWLLTLLGVGSVLLVFESIIGRDAGVALLAVMLCLKIMEIHSLRDAMIALFIGYFMVISGFLFSQSLFMGAYLFAVVLALTTALTALNHHGAPSGQSAHYLKTSGSMLLQAIPLMVILFILFPRISSPLWSMPKAGVSAVTGLSDSINMGSITQLAESDEVAFRVHFDNNTIPPADKLYWRGPVLWHTDGRRWVRGSFDSNYTNFDYQRLDEPVRYTVTLEPHANHWLFALDLPAALPQDLPGGAVLSADYQLLGRRKIHNRLRYSTASVLSYRLLELPEWLRQQALQLPAEANPQSRALAKHWRETVPSDRDLVDQALQHFIDQPFHYTRTPPGLGDNPVDEFLFTTRQGFCEHYATSFVTLMRAAGIPARVVTGYQGGELNQLGDYLVVRQRNAHAWAEVWLEREGWIRIDPTSVIPAQRVNTTLDVDRFRNTMGSTISTGAFSPLTNALFRLRQSWDAINNGWNQWVLGFDQARQSQLLKQLGLKSFSWQTLVLLMMALFFSVLLVIALSMLIRQPRQRDPVLRHYQRFCHKLERAGLNRRADEGPRAFASRVGTRRTDLREPTEQITLLYEALRYGNSSDKDQLRELKQRVAAFRV